jgi:hypothetical protein
VQQLQHMGAATARGQHTVHPGAVEQGADAVAVAREQARQHGHKLGGDVALALVAGAEVHRRAQVEQEPSRHFAVLGEDAHMRLLQPRGHVPVDVPHVVVVLVLAQIGQIESRAAHQRAVVPLQQPVQPPNHRPFKAAEQRFRRT